MTDTLNDLRNATTEAETLRLNLLDVIGDDEIALLRDSIEGETDIHELIALAVEQVMTDRALIAGIASHAKRLADRKARIEHRVDVMCAALASAFEAAVLKSVETPSGTITLKAKPQACIITDEQRIPSSYFITPDPKLDKRALLADLKAADKDGRTIPGATLSNGGTTIQIRIS